jgi:hypothetical protein
MMETGVVIAIDGSPLYWHVPFGRTTVSLPDSNDLWSVLWKAFKAGILAGFAHTHPGSGIPSPSGTDLTTFAAIEAGLGTKLKWWILSSDHVVLIDDSEDGCYVSRDVQEPSWAADLRRLSE